MTLQEAAKRFQISMEKLNLYEKNGLLECRQLIDGVPDYTEDELRRLGLIHSLLKAGFDMDSLRKYFSLSVHNSADKEEKIRLLRKQRCRLLDEIHGKQQSLDELDYLIEKIRKQPSAFDSLDDREEITFSLVQ